MAKDYLGDDLPDGYQPWLCPVCTAGCNFEAMAWCSRAVDCGFERDQPESNHGCFAFMVPDNRSASLKT